MIPTFEILYEDADMVVINKPFAILVHPDTTGAFSVSDWVLGEYPEVAEVGEPTRLPNGTMVMRPGIVHRLDRDTSGALVIAKTPAAYEYLKKQFQDREVQKIYRVFVYGEMKDEEGVINRPIGRSASDFRKWSAQRGARGELREAVTEYKVLHARKDCSYIEAYPKTGRTHQIRVHMKAINHPVMGDTLYAPHHKALLGFERLALHAFSLSFKNLQGKEVSVTAPLPADFLRGEAEIGIAR